MKKGSQAPRHSEASSVHVKRDLRPEEQRSWENVSFAADLVPSVRSALENPPLLLGDESTLPVAEPCDYVGAATEGSLGRKRKTGEFSDAAFAKFQRVFQRWRGPSVADILTFNEQLCRVYGHRTQRSSGKTVLDGLVAVMLSQNTTDRNSSAAFHSLKSRFRTWQEVRQCNVAELEESIRVGGLAPTKARRIKKLLDQLFESNRGELSLEHLRHSPTEEVVRELSQFDGIGPKSISCVLLFTMGRHDFPVDTHVHRLCSRFGWTPAQSSREDTYHYMNALVPDGIQYELHVNMVQHGRKICKSQAPMCSMCHLCLICPTGQKRVHGKTDTDIEDLISLQSVEHKQTATTTNTQAKLQQGSCA
eukprot:ANDGO_04769.mRNA.1 Putative DNA glycosylase At3g47830